jgi:predicted nuclease of predicted toxin-antitoxin system
VKFLIDNNLSPQVAVLLREAGHDTAHVRDYAMQAAPDEQVLARARDEDRILVSADTDFGMLLSRLHTSAPSVVLVRRLAGRRARDMTDVILANLPPVEEDLAAGAIVVLGEESVRVRRLPI